MTKMLIDEAKLLLMPYYQIFRDGLQMAFDEFDSYPAEHLISFENRTKANIIRDRAIAYYRRVFQLESNVKIFDIDSLFTLEIDGKLLLRVNKLGEDFLLCGKQNKRTKMFLNQEELFPELSYIPNNLIVGYKINTSWDDRIFIISSPNGVTSEWTINIDDELNKINNINNIEVEDNEISSQSKLVRIKDNSLRKVSNYENN